VRLWQATVFRLANVRGAEGFESVSFYGVSVTIADFLLRDGKRLEGVGVMPEMAVGPAAEALLKKYDPVLSYAALLFGTEITQEKAGEMYFMIEKPEKTEQEGEDAKKENDSQ